MHWWHQFSCLYPLYKKSEIFAWIKRKKVNESAYIQKGEIFKAAEPRWWEHNTQEKESRWKVSIEQNYGSDGVYKDVTNQLSTKRSGERLPVTFEITKNVTDLQNNCLFWKWKVSVWIRTIFVDKEAEQVSWYQKRKWDSLDNEPLDSSSCTPPVGSRVTSPSTMTVVVRHKSMRSDRFSFSPAGSESEYTDDGDTVILSSEEDPDVNSQSSLEAREQPRPVSIPPNPSGGVYRFLITLIVRMM